MYGTNRFPPLDDPSLIMLTDACFFFKKRQWYHSIWVVVRVMVRVMVVVMVRVMVVVLEE